MPFSDTESLLRDILESINLIEDFVRGMEMQAYVRDAMAHAAVERKLLVISEAAIRLGPNAEVECRGSHGGIFAALAIGYAINTITSILKPFGTRSSMISQR